VCLDGSRTASPPTASTGPSVVKMVNRVGGIGQMQDEAICGNFCMRLGRFNHRVREHTFRGDSNRGISRRLDSTRHGHLGTLDAVIYESGTQVMDMGA